MAQNNDPNFTTPLPNGSACVVQPPVAFDPNKLVSFSDPHQQQPQPQQPNHCDPATTALIVPNLTAYTDVYQNGVHVNSSLNVFTLPPNGINITPAALLPSNPSEVPNPNVAIKCPPVELVAAVAANSSISLGAVARIPQSPRRFVCVTIPQNLSAPSIGAIPPDQHELLVYHRSPSGSGSEATLDQSPTTSHSPSTQSSSTGPKGHSSSRGSGLERSYEQPAEGEGDESENDEQQQQQSVESEAVEQSVEASEGGDQFDSSADPHAAVVRQRRSGLAVHLQPGARRHSAFSNDSKRTPSAAVTNMRTSSSSSSPTAVAVTSASRAENEPDDKDRPLEYSPNRRFTKLNTEVGRGSFKTVFKCMEAVTGIELAWCELQVRSRSRARPPRS